MFVACVCHTAVFNEPCCRLYAASCPSEDHRNRAGLKAVIVVQPHSVCVCVCEMRWRKERPRKLAPVSACADGGHGRGCMTPPRGTRLLRPALLALAFSAACAVLGGLLFRSRTPVGSLVNPPLRSRSPCSSLAVEARDAQGAGICDAIPTPLEWSIAGFRCARALASGGTPVQLSLCGVRDLATPWLPPSLLLLAEAQHDAPPTTHWIVNDAPYAPLHASRGRVVSELGAEETGGCS